MAGLLDNFFGDSWDDPKSQAVMAMAQGLMAPRVAGRNSFSDALSNYTQTMSAGQEAQFKRKLQQAQIEKYGAETQIERSKLEQAAKKDAMMMGLFGGGSMGGAIAPPEGMNVPANVTGGQRSDPFAGVDKTALMLDYLQNGGKNMGGWVNDRTKPDMQVTGGYAYDKNKMGAGFMPSLTTSTDGKTSMIRIGPDGLPVVSAPQGAVETFGAYQGKQADFKPIKVFNPTTGREEYQTEGGVVRGAQGQQPVLRGPTPMAGPAGNVQSSGYNGGSRDSANAESIRIIENEMMNPRATAQDKAAMAREIQRLQGQSGALPSLQPAAPQFANNAANPGFAAVPPQSGAFAAGPSLKEAAQAEAEKARLIDTAKATAKNVSPAMMEELFKADDAARAGKSVIKTLDEVSKLNNDAYSGFGAKTRATVVSNLPFASKSADATISLDNMLTGQALDSMKAIFGSNPTEGERQVLLSMQASADKTPKQRQDIMDRAKEAASSRIKFNEEKAKAIRAGTYLNEPLNTQQESQSSTPAPKPMLGMVQGGYKFKGGNPADKANWEKQ